MIEHILRCDVTLPNGHRCESRAMTRFVHEVPIGWATIMRSVKATKEDLDILGYMKPVIDASIELNVADAARGKDVTDLAAIADRMAAGMIENAQPIMMTGHICDQHELPNVGVQRPGLPGV